MRVYVMARKFVTPAEMFLKMPPESGSNPTKILMAPFNLNASKL